VPEVMAFQTKSLGDGVYRLSPFTSGAYEIFAQVRGEAPLKGLVNRAGSDGRRNTIYSVDPTILPLENRSVWLYSLKT